MQYDQYMEEMKGKILLTDSKIFLYCAGIVGAYYVTFLYYLLHTMLQSGQFH